MLARLLAPLTSCLVECICPSGFRSVEDEGTADESFDEVLHPVLMLSDAMAILTLTKDSFWVMIP